MLIEPASKVSGVTDVIRTLSNVPDKVFIPAHALHATVVDAETEPAATQVPSALLSNVIVTMPLFNDAAKFTAVITNPAVEEPLEAFTEA